MHVTSGAYTLWRQELPLLHLSWTSSYGRCSSGCRLQALSAHDTGPSITCLERLFFTTSLTYPVLGLLPGVASPTQSCPTPLTSAFEESLSSCLKTRLWQVSRDFLREWRHRVGRGVKGWFCLFVCFQKKEMWIINSETFLLCHDVSAFSPKGGGNGVLPFHP